MHIELDTIEIMVIISWWVVSKWLARFIIIGLITKVVAKFKEKAGEKIDKLKNDFKEN